MKPDDVNIDEVARLVFGEAGAGTPPEREAAMRIIREEVRGLVAALERDDSVPAPADLVRRTAALVRRRGLVASIAAVLVYDSRARRQDGFRSTTDRGHLTFEADGEKIDLHMEPGGDRWRVRGQIGEDRSDATGIVYVTESGGLEIVTAAPIDSFGCFATDVPAGRYEFQISMPQGAIFLEGVRIG